MKTKQRNVGILGGLLLLGLLVSQAAFGQSNIVFTSINATPESAIQLHWTSTNHELYAIQFANEFNTTVRRGLRFTTNIRHRAQTRSSAILGITM